MANSPRPPFDSSFKNLISLLDSKTHDQVARDAISDEEMVIQTRLACDRMLGNQSQVMSDPTLWVERVSIPGPQGPITIILVRPIHHQANRPVKVPGIFFIHGGGMIAGDAFNGLSVVCDWIKALDAVAVSVEYRLAPEHPGTTPVEDCYAALAWLGYNLNHFEIDQDRLVMAGISAGAGLTAATALMARDRGFPKIHSQLLGCPMLDDRNGSNSCRQFFDIGTYTGKTNEFGWKCLLGDRWKTDDVSAYEAPGRADDLSGLPQAFIDVGSAEPFRDEAIEYALKPWKCGVQAELHVWPGGPHGFEVLAPETEMAQQASRLRLQWLEKRLLEPTATEH